MNTTLQTLVFIIIFVITIAMMMIPNVNPLFDIFDKSLYYYDPLTRNTDFPIMYSVKQIQ